MRRASLEGRLAASLVALVVAVAAVTALAVDLGGSVWLGLVTGGLLGIVGSVIAVPLVLSPARRALDALENAVSGLRSRDYGLRLALEEGDELGRLAAVFNELADELGRERSDLRQRELLLHTVIETSPAAVLLVNAADRIILDNLASRRLFGAGSRLSGRDIHDLLQGTPASLARAVLGTGDALVTVDSAGGRDESPESFQVAARHFDVNSRRHRLIMVRRLTVELRRQEAAAWRKVTRVIAHELNNTMAPIRSMVHSARLIRTAAAEGGPDTEDSRIDEILGHIDDSARSLQRFVDGYRSLARLPEPRLEDIELEGFLASLAEAQPFASRAPLGAQTVRADPSQLRLALVNLLKNAREAGSPVEAIEVDISRLADGRTVIRVLDRGSGLSAEGLTRAMVPFYSTREGGTGLGLALAREIFEAHGGALSIATRSGGGVEVRCDLPASSSA